MLLRRLGPRPVGAVAMVDVGQLTDFRVVVRLAPESADVSTSWRVLMSIPLVHVHWWGSLCSPSVALPAAIESSEVRRSNFGIPVIGSIYVALHLRFVSGLAPHWTAYVIFSFSGAC